MRIVRLSKGYAPWTDGWSRHVLRLSEEQAAIGHDVTVIQPLSESHTTGRLRVVKPWRGLPEPRDPLALLAFCIAALAPLRREASSADVVHVHGDVLEILFALLAARRRRVPTIATLHSVLSRRRRHRLLFGRLMRHVNGFIAVSALVAEDLVRRGLPRERLLMQSSGVDLREIEAAVRDRATTRTGMGLGTDDFMVLFVGRLEPVKGLGDLLDSVPMLPAGVRLTLIGGGSLMPWVESHAARIDMLGPKPHDETIRILAAADALVLPSVDLPGQAEGTPTVILEAFAAGIPVVATRSGGIASVVADGETGILVEQRSPAAIAAAITRLYRQPMLRSTLTTRARAVAQGQDWPVVARRVTDFTQTIVASTMPRGIERRSSRGRD